MSIEKMKQALGTLKECYSYLRSPDIYESIKVLHQAIEKLEKQKPVAEIREDMKGGGYIEWLDDTYFVPGTKFYTAPLAPAQEPVAEAYALADKVRTELDKQSCPGAFMNIAWESVVKFHRDLIYITPPQPQPAPCGITVETK